MTQHEEQGLWEKIFSRENLTAALARVQEEQGSIRSRWHDNRGVARASEGPLAEYPSEAGSGDVPTEPGEAGRDPESRAEGCGMLGIPTVQDRLIQQAMHQVLSPLFEGTFSDHSYGFRPGRSAHDAVKAAQGTRRSGTQVGGGHRPGEVL